MYFQAFHLPEIFVFLTFPQEHTWQIQIHRKLVLFHWKILKWKVTSSPTGSHSNSMLSKGTASYSLCYKYFWAECSQCPKNGPHAAFAALPLFRASNKNHAKFSHLSPLNGHLEMGLANGRGWIQYQQSSLSVCIQLICLSEKPVHGWFSMACVKWRLISPPCLEDRGPFAEQPL